jgi:hypothetical protein
VADTEMLSWDEIRKRYPDEWVILVDYSCDDNEDIIAAVVYDHSPDRDELYTRCAQDPNHPRSVAALFTGEIRGGRIVVIE